MNNYLLLLKHNHGIINKINIMFSWSQPHKVILLGPGLLLRAKLSYRIGQTYWHRVLCLIFILLHRYYIMCTKFLGHLLQYLRLNATTL